MQDFVASLGAARRETSTQADVTKMLLMCQKELKFSLFEEHSTEAVLSAMRSIWSFFLFAAGHPSGTVRLASYRATGMFLIQVTPVFPDQVRETFSDISMMSTIDIKSSAIIAASFAFLSNLVSLENLDTFMDSTPVYHNFTKFDPVFAEYLPSIIGNIGKLGFDWFRTLLHSFLAVAGTTTDRYIMKSIAAIVNHYPVELLNELLVFVCEQKDLKPYIGLTSFVLAAAAPDTIQIADLGGIAHQALQVFLNVGEVNITEIDSALQILSMSSSSFRLEVTVVRDEVLQLVLMRGELVETAEIEAHKYRNRSVVFNLPLPWDLCLPDFEKEGALTLNAKLMALAACVNRESSSAREFFDIVSVHVTKEYSQIVSACMRAIMLCLPVLLEQCDIVDILRSVVFTRRTSWLHMFDILSLIEAVPIQRYEAIFGRGNLMAIVDVLVEGCMSAKTNVCDKAKEILAALAATNFDVVAAMLCMKVDFFDRTLITKWLSTLGYIADVYPNQAVTCMRTVIIGAAELCYLWKDDIEIVSAVFEFIGHFNLEVIGHAALKRVIERALCIIAGSFHEVYGKLVTGNMKVSRIEKARAMITRNLYSQNLDVISEDGLTYETCMHPLLNSIKVLLAVPASMLDAGIIAQFIPMTLNIFPVAAVALMDKCWMRLLDNDKEQILKTTSMRLKHTQNYDVLVGICKFVGRGSQMFRDRVIGIKEELVRIVRIVLTNRDFMKAEQLRVLEAFIIPGGDNFLSVDSDIYLGSATSDIVSEEVQAEFVLEAMVTLREDLYREVPITQSIAKTQLSYGTYPFDRKRLQEIFDHFCNVRDLAGIAAVMKRAKSHKVVLHVEHGKVPKGAAGSVLNYLAYVQPDRVRAFTVSCWSERDDEDDIRAAITVDSTGFLNFLEQSERVTGSQLRNLAASIHTTTWDLSLLQATVTKCFSVVHSAKKFSYVTAVLANALSIGKLFNRAEMANIFAVLDSREGSVSIVHMICCVRALAPVLDGDAQVQKINDWIKRFPVVSPISAPLVMALYQTNGNPIFERDAPRRAGELLKEELPSYFFAGIRVFSYALSRLPEKRIQSLLKKCVRRLIRSYPTYISIFGIADVVNNSLSAVFRNAASRGNNEVTAGDIDRVIPVPSQANFIEMVPCMGLTIRVSRDSRNETDQRIMKRVGQMVTHPICVELSREYLIIAEATIEQTGRLERSRFVAHVARQWLRKYQDSDGYAVAIIIRDWCILMARYATIDDLLSFTCSEIFSASTRFISPFDGVSRFMRSKYRNEEVKAALLEKSRELGPTCRAHSIALRLMDSPSTIRVAYQLAMFDADCPESDKIADSLQTSSSSPTSPSAAPPNPFLVKGNGPVFGTFLGLTASPPPPAAQSDFTDLIGLSGATAGIPPVGTPSSDLIDLLTESPSDMLTRSPPVSPTQPKPVGADDLIQF